MENNCHLVMHEAKRSLSLHEKSSLLTTSGKALVLPAHPPTSSHQRGEIEELLQCGFAPHQIRGIERDQTIAEELFEHYYDEVPILWEDVEEFLNRSSATFSYVHLDFCQHLNPSVVQSLALLSDRLNPISRIRCSVSFTRRQSGQQQYESRLRSLVVLPLLRSAQAHDEVPQRWEPMIKEMTDSDDSTQIIATLWLFHHVFHQDPLAFADACATQDVGLPRFEGDLLLWNMQRFQYHEPLGKTSMYTLWADTFPCSKDIYQFDREPWLVQYLYLFFMNVATPCVPYVPSLGGPS